jgi:hypothetical protein
MFLRTRHPDILVSAVPSTFSGASDPNDCGSSTADSRAEESANQQVQAMLDSAPDL